MPRHLIHAVTDGFNLYHSICEAIDVIQKENYINRQYGKPESSLHMKWLDLRKMCESFLSRIRQELGTEVELGDIHYFSALAHHRGPDTVARHRDYLRALEASGVTVQPLSQFKDKEYKCRDCKKVQTIPVEKETDVAVASKLIELAATEACDSLLLLSGDTDLLPALRTVRLLRPSMRIIVGLPYGRDNGAFKRVSDLSFQLSTKVYRKSQLNDPVVLPNGVEVRRPPKW